MKKNILVFSNGEKIGDGLIKLPLLNEIKRRLPDRQLIWMTNKGTTVYNNQLKNIADKYIDQIIEKANLKPFFWQKISNSYNLEDLSFDYILDTQKAILRTIALKRIKSSIFDYPIISTNSSYVNLVRRHLLKGKIKKYKIFIAYYLGKTRLIDNI